MNTDNKQPVELKTVQISFGSYDLNEEQTHVLYEGENCEIFTDQDGEFYITPNTNHGDPLYFDRESQPKRAYKSKHGMILGYLVTEECTLGYTNYEYDEKIYIQDHGEDNDWKGIEWYDTYPEIFEPIFDPQQPVQPESKPISQQLKEIWEPKQEIGDKFKYEAEIHCYGTGWTKFEFNADSAALARDHVTHILATDEISGFDWITPPTQFFYIMWRKKGNVNWKYVYTSKPFDPEKNTAKTITEYLKENESLKAINEQLKNGLKELLASHYRLTGGLSPTGLEASIEALLSKASNL